MRRVALPALSFLLLVLAACYATTDPDRNPDRNNATAPAAAPALAKPRCAAYRAATNIGKLSDRDIDESSGIAASRKNEGVYWTHNDSGDGPFIYAFDREGQRRGVWRVEGAFALDWEDIAAAEGRIYVGDIGDNLLFREHVTVYIFPEPAVSAEDAGVTRAQPRRTASAQAIKIRYPDGKYDAEALLVHPVSGDLYLVTKALKAGQPAFVYKLPAPSTDTNEVATLMRIGALTLDGKQGRLNRITGGDIAPDGQRVVLCDSARAYELCLPAGAKDFDEIWQQRLAPVAIGKRKGGEAICYRLDGRALITTSEGRHAQITESLAE